MPAPYAGSIELGYKLAEYSLGQLVAGFNLSNISSGSIPFSPPPNGTWVFTLLVTEYIAPEEMMASFPTTISIFPRLSLSDRRRLRRQR